MRGCILFAGLLFSSAALADEFTADQIRLHELHCSHRARNGRAVQVLDAGLCRQAQRLAEAQAAAGSMFHSSWGFQENVAYGAGPDYTMTMWVNSRGHNANLLCGQTHVGFGMCNGHSAALFGAAYVGEDLAVSAMRGSGSRRGLFRRWKR